MWVGFKEYALKFPCDCFNFIHYLILFHIIIAITTIQEDKQRKWEKKLEKKKKNKAREERHDVD